MRARVLAVAAVVALGGCGAHHEVPDARVVPAVPAQRVPPRHAVVPRSRERDPVALVTCERRNELVSIDARTGRVLRRVHAPADPENVVAGARAVLVSAAAHTVTVLDPFTLRIVTATHRFRFPHIATLGPLPGVAYVSDEAAGTVTPVLLAGGRALTPIRVGLGAHHMTVSPDGRRLWVALGESAATIVILDLSRPLRPRVIRRFEPGFVAHDVVFAPGGQDVWVSSATGPDVVILDARSLRVRRRIRVGAPPAHIAFGGSSAYLTSGYSGRIERVAIATGRVLARAVSPYGSFELGVAGGYVMTASLLTGAVTCFDADLRRRWTETVGPATRDLAVVAPARAP